MNSHLLINTNKKMADYMLTEEDLVAFPQLKITQGFTPLDMCFYGDEYTDIRRKTVLALSRALDKHSEFKKLTFEEKTAIFREFEKHCHEKTICSPEQTYLYADIDNFYDIFYETLTMQKIMLLNPSYGYEFVAEVSKRFLDKTFSIKEFVYCEIQELCSDLFEKEQRMLQERKEIKICVKTSSIYKCKKCKKNEVIIRDRQTRCLDEASSEIICCTNCGYTWKCA